MEQMAAEKEAGSARPQNLCFLPIFKRNFHTLPDFFPIFNVAQMKGNRKYFGRQKFSCTKQFSNMNKIPKASKNSVVLRNILIYLLITRKPLNIFPNDW